MTRRKTRRTLRLENLEDRSLLTAGGPSPDAQHMLELINLARTNPSGAAQWVEQHVDANVKATLDAYHVDLQSELNQIAASPVRAPLAWNSQLSQSATAHSQDQANTGVQSHLSSTGLSTEERMDQVSYTNRVADGENVYAYSQSVDHAMEAFLLDWGVSSKGHRHNLLQNDVPEADQYRDVGIGIVASNKPGFGPFVITQDFGTQSGAKAQLLGVAYNDPNHSHQFAPGQGRGDVTIQVTNKATGQRQSVQTWDSGGYQIALDRGDYTETALVGNVVVKSRDVTIGADNVKVDFDLSDPWTGTVPKPTPPVQAPAKASVLADNLMASINDVSWLTSWSQWTAGKAGH